MAEANHVRFKARLDEIERRHKRLASGYVRLEERDGLLVPVEAVQLRRGLPLRGMLWSLLAFILFKGFLMAQIGPLAYVERVGRLEAGNIVEQMGAWAMQPDPATRYIATRLRGLF